jgi:hypothetical protein
MAQPHVVTVILNTNRRDDTLACLDSLRASTYTNHSIIVLDNASSDGSLDAIRTAHPQVEVLSLSVNKGYAGNNNVGIAAALARGADWVFVLNEDTIVAPDCIARLVAVAERESRAAALGPLVFHYDEPQVIQSAGGRIGRDWSAWHIAQNEVFQGQFVQPTLVDWVSGCAILVKRAAIEQVGMLDERFFYYWEETEWCLRMQRAGWQILHVPAAPLWHKGVQRDYRPKPSVAYYDTRNHLLMMAKHRAPLRAWLQSGGRRLRTLLSYSVRPQWRHKRAYRDAMWFGARDFLRGHWGKGPI